MMCSLQAYALYRMGKYDEVGGDSPLQPMHIIETIPMGQNGTAKHSQTIHASEFNIARGL